MRLYLKRVKEERKVERGIKMVKLIATDMDGTLLNAAHEVSKENVEAIQYAQSQGVTVVMRLDVHFMKQTIQLFRQG